MLKYFLFILLFNVHSINANEHFAENLELNLNSNPIYYYTNQALEDGIFINNIPNPKFDNNELLNHRIIPAKIKCDSNVFFKESFFIKKGSEFDFHASNQTQKYTKVNLKILNPNTKCILNYISQNGEFAQVNILPFQEAIPEIKSYESNLKNKSEIIDDGIDSINKRIEILTGKKISHSEIEERNPNIQLDFSYMPKYDFILFATLQFNNDFISNVVFKALAVHARQGTPVAVLVNTRLIGAKERKLLNWLKGQSSNIKVMEYEFYPDSNKLGDKLDQIHRVSHVKLLATYSATHPELNQVISGGRNNSDRYFFKDFKKFNDNQFTDFDKEISNKWAQFYDMDFYVNSTHSTVSVINQTLDFLKIRKNINLSSNLDPNDFNFNISIPYRAQKKQLEDEYVTLIESAKSSISILTPYIYFTDKIDKAISDAASRGVKIKIITSSSLLGDGMTKIVKNVYDKYAGFRKSRIEILSYNSDNKTVMHRKAMLIDNDILILGSVNLSNRSFYHDIEVTCKINDEEMIKNFKAVFQTQLENSHKPTLTEKNGLINKILNAFNSDDIL